MRELTTSNSTTGVGTFTITVTVSSGSTVPGAIVFARSGSTVVAWGQANGSGQLVLNLNSGAYTLGVQNMPGYQSFTPQALNVTGNASVTLTLVPQSITPPVTPGLCTVRFLILDNGNPVQGATVDADLEELNPMVDTALIARVKKHGATNSNGYVDMTLIQFSQFTRGGIYKIRVSDRSGKRLHERRVKVPSQTSCYAEDLIDA